MLESKHELKYKPRDSFVDVKLLANIRRQHRELGPNNAIQSSAKIQRRLYRGCQEIFKKCYDILCLKGHYPFTVLRRILSSLLN